ncbi:MAG TPA: methyltransferase domain-containing protein [Euzebyales bacterium]|nr:methyltransferase domain-containing protein [Euzebyales bacterium]
MIEPFYDAELAAVHEADFTDVARSAAGVLLRRLADAGHHSGTIVDLGSGGGALAGVLVDAGYDVLGIDLSAAMVELARANVPGARFVQGSVWDAALPPAVAVTAIGEVVNYAADARAGVDQLAHLIDRVRTELAPGGVFLFDIATPGRGGPDGRRTGFTDTAAYTMHFESREATDDDGTATLERRMVLFTRDGDVYRRSDEVHHLRLYRAATVTDLLEAAGFEATMLAAYGERLLPSGWIAIAATVPATAS